MIHSATRLAAPCLLIGLATAKMQINENRDSIIKLLIVTSEYPQKDRLNDVPWLKDQVSFLKKKALE